MALKRLTRLKCIPQATIEALHQHGVYTCKDLLCSSPLELMAVLGFSYSQLQDLIVSVSKVAAPTSKNVLTLHKRERSRIVPTSLDRLDSLLRGGLHPGTIIEIGGPPGCGKTQFCLTVATETAFCGRHVAYIDTEGGFSAERLVEIAKRRHSDLSTSEHLLSLASRVHVFTEMSLDLLQERLEQLEEIIVKNNVQLVIIDSIASLIRKEFDVSSKKGVADRATALTTQAARLKYIAESFDTPILVTNQITTRISHDPKVEEGGTVTVALGNSWSHSVNTRLLMQHRDGNKRMMIVSKSPLSGVMTFVVAIEGKGVVVMDHTETDKLTKDNERISNRDPQLISLTVHNMYTRHS